MALPNTTAKAALAIEDMFLLLDNSTLNATMVRNSTMVTIAQYPSGYTLPQIVIASIIVTILMIVVVVGNMLVIIAITTEKALKNIQNWFIASLAVADFFLGLVIMPFSLANELMGYWIFGLWWCDIHSAMDVLLSTASIMNLCLISLDRYWSITQAIEYLKKRTPVRAILMIGAVWILSALICIPPLLGWKVERTPDDRFPQCQLSEELGYVLYSALGSFYIPSCIMVFVYIRIYYAAKARARRGIRKPPRRPAQEQVTSFVAAKNGASVASAAGTPRASINSPMGDSTDKQIATIESHPRPMPIPTVTCDLASDISTSDMGAPECGIGQDGHESKDTLKVSEFDPSSSDSGVVAQCTAVQPLKLRLKPIFGRGKQPKRNRSDETKKLAKSPSERAISTASEGGGVTTPTTVVPRVQKPKDPERERRRIARKKEKRATLILGLIMGSFIACWLPFFCMYVLRLAYDIPPFAFSTAFWLGYMNSALNPVIYTIFNKDFRRAFRRILFK